MKKILIVSTVSRQFYLFEQGNIEVLKSLGYEIHGAANFSDANERLDALDIIRHPFDIQRSPFSLKNIKAYRQLKMIMKSENFDVVHCHSPMGGVLARLAAKAIGVSPVIYTAHGFHFYKGAPLINWLVYYPVEKFLARYTDVLITINQEDYSRARKFKAKKVMYVPGIGVDIEKISGFTVDRGKKREELGVPRDAFVILSVGELSKRKNHEVVIKALARIGNPSIYYVICGQGDKQTHLKRLAQKRGISDRVLFIGFRNDVHEICRAVDIFVFPSYREGLPVALMEAMASGLPCVVSRIRGNVDLVNDCLVDPDDIIEITKNIDTLYQNADFKSMLGERNRVHVKYFDKSRVTSVMKDIYAGLI